MLGQLQEAVRRQPVIGVLYGVDSLPALLASDCRAPVVANIDLLLLPKALEVLTQQGIFSIVNIDSIPGLAQDRGGVDYLQALGAAGVVSTRGSLMQRIQHARLLAMQKVFVTDRSNLPRALDSVRASHPDLVQVMPGPWCRGSSRRICGCSNRSSSPASSPTRPMCGMPLPPARSG